MKFQVAIVGAPEADPGFLERGFACIKVWGVRIADLISFFLIAHENEVIWSH